MPPYLYNVATSFAPYLVISIALAIGGRFYAAWIKTIRPAPTALQDINVAHGFMKMLNLLTLAVLVAGLFYALISPTNTPKNVIGNIKAENKATTDANAHDAARSPGVIKDISRQPKMTDDERKEHFDRLVDYKKD